MGENPTYLPCISLNYRDNNFVKLVITFVLQMYLPPRKLLLLLHVQVSMHIRCMIHAGLSVEFVYPCSHPPSIYNVGRHRIYTGRFHLTQRDKPYLQITTSCIVWTISTRHDAMLDDTL